MTLLDRFICFIAVKKGLYRATVNFSENKFWDNFEEMDNK